MNRADVAGDGRRPRAGRDPGVIAGELGSRLAPGRPNAPPAAAPSVGFRTLLAKEVLRFWKVSFQTVAAPVLTGVLYLLVFGHVLEDRVRSFPA